MGGKCVKLCTVHVSVCVGGGVHVGESVLNCVLHMSHVQSPHYWWGGE